MARKMQIWPAIDLRGGLCVRLQQGDYDRETVFGEDPADMARHWVRQGAERLHLVDLDGARDGRQANAQSVRDIRRAVDIPLELGGGIRDEQTIAQLLDAGIDRLVIGTRALREPAWFREVCQAFPGRLVLGIDARDGRVATDGWRQTTVVPATELAADLQDETVAAVIYTDIATDGMLTGPNLPAMQEMVGAVSLPVIASGGIATAKDVERLAALGVAGCIIGRALYEGKLSLADARAAAGEV